MVFGFFLKRTMYAVCGYSGSGKDTLIAELQQEILVECESDVKWEVYAKDSKDAAFWNLGSEIKKFAFADGVRDETHRLLGLEKGDALERVRDKVTINGAPLNWWYLRVEEEGKVRDVDIWAKIVYAKIKEGDVAFISDYRFRTELQKPTTTIRLFRSEVHIPFGQEHRDLDEVVTNYLLVPPGEFAGCVARFPQYGDFKLHSRLGLKKQKKTKRKFESFLSDCVQDVVYGFLNITERDYLCGRWTEIAEPDVFAAANGFLDLLLWFDDHHPQIPTEKRMIAAAKNGHVKILKKTWFIKNHAENVCYAAAASGQFKVVKYLYKKLKLITDYSIGAASGGHSKIVKWAHENRMMRNYATVTQKACKKGHLNILKLLYRYDDFRWHKGCTANTVFSGNLKMVKWIHKNIKESVDDIGLLAASSGSWDILKWALKKKLFFQSDADSICEKVASHSNLKMMKLAFKYCCPIGESLCTIAAMKSDLKMLKWLREKKKCVWDESVYVCAAFGHNYVDIVAYAHENGCPKDKRFCIELTRQGNLEMLQWAVDNGFPFDKDACFAKCRDQEIKDWITQKNIN